MYSGAIGLFWLVLNSKCTKWWTTVLCGIDSISKQKGCRCLLNTSSSARIGLALYSSVGLPPQVYIKTRFDSVARIWHILFCKLLRRPICLSQLYTIYLPWCCQLTSTFTKRQKYWISGRNSVSSCPRLDLPVYRQDQSVTPQAIPLNDTYIVSKIN